MTRTYVFLGPTLSQEDARLELDAVYLPPVAQGDVYRVAQKAPTAIVIVDGAFHNQPAVWHKEILWALTRGIHVFGGASMGALRAVELATFGMEGIGRIFEAFRDGSLEDDDEVAVAMAPAEGGYRALSEAMVNIRSTLAAAYSQRVVSSRSRAELSRIAKALYYPERSWPSILRLAREGVSVAPAEIAAFSAWLPGGRVDQKREDALVLLRSMRERLAGDLKPKRVTFHLEHSEWWDRLERDGGLLEEDEAGAEMLLFESWLDELRLDPATYESAFQAAGVRLLALPEAERRGIAATSEEIQERSDRFRSELGLLETSQMQIWLDANHLDVERFGELMHEEVLLDRLRSTLERDVSKRLPDQLRLAGGYTSLVRRTLEKERALAESGLTNPGIAEAGGKASLVAWYFESLGRPVPSDLDRFVRDLGFSDQKSWLRAVVREHCWRRLQDTERSGS